MWLDEAAFADEVIAALDALPAEIRDLLDNVEVLVVDWPSPDQLASVGVTGDETLLGLYEGIPRTERTSDYGMVLPDSISLFRGPILSICRTRGDVRSEVRHTVVHELAHHFGIDDDRLIELGAY